MLCTQHPELKAVIPSQGTLLHIDSCQKDGSSHNNVLHILGHYENIHSVCLQVSEFEQKLKRSPQLRHFFKNCFPEDYGRKIVLLIGFALHTELYRILRIISTIRSPKKSETKLYWLIPKPQTDEENRNYQLCLLVRNEFNSNRKNFATLYYEGVKGLAEYLWKVAPERKAHQRPERNSMSDVNLKQRTSVYDTNI